MGVSTTIAPLIGGVITQWLGWRWIFLLNLPICVLLAWCAGRGIRESRNPHAGAIDWLGIWALIGTQADGWTGWRSEARLAACVVLFAIFVRVQTVHQHPMIDLALFRQPRFAAAVLAMFGYAACAQVMMTFLPLYLQNAFGLPAVRAGIGMLPFAMAMVIGPHIGAKLSKRVPGMTLLTLGLATIGAGNLLTAWFAGMASYPLIGIGMIVTGLGADVLNGDTQKAIMACVPPHRTGMASGISTTTRFTAIVTSVGVLGAVLATRTQHALDAHAGASAELRRTFDATFLSRVLAGDLAHAGAVSDAIAQFARISFASGFSAALAVAGVCALCVAMAVWVLAGRRSEEAARGEAAAVN